MTHKKLNEKPSKLIDLVTREERDVWCVNFPPFVSMGTVDFKSSTGKVIYWPEFLIKTDSSNIRRLEDSVFILICDEIKEFVKIQLYDVNKLDYLVFRPYTITDNLEIIRRLSCDGI